MTVYASTHFDMMDFEAEGLIYKIKISLKNETSCFGHTKKFILKIPNLHFHK